MRRVLTSAAWAALITAIPLVATWWAMGRIASPDSWLAMSYRIAELPIWPGVYLAALVGNRGGPDGMPSVLAMFIAAFVFWWAAIAGVQAAWKAGQRPEARTLEPRTPKPPNSGTLNPEP